MDYEKSQQIKQIQDDIIRSTYNYFKQCDLFFRDYIYGDPYYQTLSNLAYSFLGRRQMNYSIDCQCLGMIDVIQLVSDLYAVFIKADTKYKQRETVADDRHRKNYIHKALRRATWKLLYKQFKRYLKIKENQADIDETLNNNLKRFRYVSFDVYEDDSLVDQLSYDRWASDTEADRDCEAKKDVVWRMMIILNSLEVEVIGLSLEGLHFADIAKSLDLTTEQIRKIFHRAKTKLVKKYNQIRRLKNGEKTKPQTIQN